MPFLISLLTLFLWLPAGAGNAGPLDGPWTDSDGNTLTITSGLLNADIVFRNATGEQAYRARYTGYTTLILNMPGWGVQTFALVGGDKLKVTGGPCRGLYRRVSSSESR